MLGSCTPSAGAITSHSKEIEATTGRLAVNVMPNPSAESFTLNVSSDPDAPLILRVIDISGRVIERKNLTANQTIKIGERYRPGMYLAEIIQGNERKIMKLVKIQ